MSKFEVPTPSPAELRRHFTGTGDEPSIADALVHVALGFDEDNDYAGLVRELAYMGGVREIAKAEARLQIIESNDERKPGCTGYLEESERTRLRVLDVDTIVQALSPEDRDLFFEEFEKESNILEAEQFAADNGLGDL